VGDAEDLEHQLVGDAGLDLWWYETEMHERFCFTQDVIEHTSACVDSVADDEGLPGRSFVVFEVHVQDQSKFFGELRSRVRELAEAHGILLPGVEDRAAI